MKKYMALGLCVVLVGLFAVGCAKKEQPLEQMQEPLPVEVAPMSTTAPATGTQAAQPAALPVAGAPQVTTNPAAAQEGIALPPQGPYKPTNAEVQTALKAAGFYTGEVDGKIGPKTKKAIEAFQTANNLKADGKVGPKTWSLLSTHLAPAAAPVPATTKTK